jgi:exodeoxyribonuclease V alpha subunit
MAGDRRRKGDPLGREKDRQDARRLPARRDRDGAARQGRCGHWRARRRRKTTLLDAILRMLAAKGVKILLGAPTGRAAKRMTEQTGIEAKTIHRLLEIDPKYGGFKRNVENSLDCDLLVIDETSMVDISLMFAVMKAIPSKAALLLVGDVDQLPSVGPGQALADIINSGAILVARLTEVFRQAAESRIVVNAHRINRGEMPEWPKRGENSDFWFVDAKDPEDGAAKVVELVRDRIPRRFGLDPIRDIQVLCPMQRGALGARSLNADLQKALNPNPSARIEKFGSVFAPGDKIMQTENDYDRDVFNGDLGTVLRIDENFLLPPISAHWHRSGQPHQGHVARRDPRIEPDKHVTSYTKRLAPSL